MLPVRIALLVLKPDLWPESLGLQALEPHVAPAGAYNLRIRRAGIEHLHDGPPGKIVAEEASAGVVNVLFKTVIRSHDGDDRLELRGPARGNLQ